MSFECPHCNFTSSEVQPAGEIQVQGHKFSFRVENEHDLNRQLIKSDTCIFRIEELELEMPPGRGQLTNVEGILAMIGRDLTEKQSERKDLAPGLYDQLEPIIDKLAMMATEAGMPFTITVDDPAGNSWIEPSTENKPGKYVRRDYDRTAEQNINLGLAAEESASTAVADTHEYRATHMQPELPPQSMVRNVDNDDIVENEVYTFPATCPGCSKPCDTNMKMVNIPHFKQAIIMSTVCSHCDCESLGKRRFATELTI